MFDNLSTIEQQALYILLKLANAKQRYFRVSFDSGYVALLRTGQIVAIASGEKTNREYATLAQFLDAHPLHKCEI